MIDKLFNSLYRRPFRIRRTVLREEDDVATLPSCFVAYPSAAPDRAESVETAIKEIQGGGVVDIIGWKDLAVTGRLLMGVVCDEISRRDVLIADVTGLNPNLLFELGYAIARRKRVWLILNPNISHARSAWDQFRLLTTVGFAPYCNSQDIVGQFYKHEPYKRLDEKLYEELLKAAGPSSKPDALLYLRCDINTDASMRVARLVSSGPIRSIIDDPQEIRLQPFAWYVQQVSSAFAVVCHLLSNEYQNWHLHNAKHALIAAWHTAHQNLC